MDKEQARRAAGGMKSGAGIKRELREQLKQKGWWNPVSAELVEEYLDARQRLLTAKQEYAGLAGPVGLSAADDASLALGESMAHSMKIMTDILGALQVTPATARRAAMEAEMREQLAARGLTGTVFADRVDAFLKLWDAFQDANSSLTARGRTYMTISSAGKQYEKDNAAAKDVVALAKAMGDILDELKITVDDFAAPDDAEL